MKLQAALEYNLYQNNRVFHPEGNLMFYANNKKIAFYLNKKLAKIIKENDDNTLDIQLTFTPNGKGCIHEYELIPKENICVVTGVSEELTRHHVVPEAIRIFLPHAIKSRNSHDVVLISAKIHAKYETRYAAKFMEELAHRYNALTPKEFNKQFAYSLRPHKIAHTLLKYGNEIPYEKCQELIAKFVQDTTLEPTLENLKLYNSNFRRKQEEKYGEYFVPFIPDLKEFCKEWRQHFLDTMKPKFMPQHWSVEGIYNHR